MADMTPEALRDKLLGDLRDRVGDIARRHRYHDGDHDLPAAPDPAVAIDFMKLAKLAKLNMCELIVDAVSERMQLQGVRLTPADANEPENDIEVWKKVWQPNKLDAVAVQIHDEAFISGRSFVLVQAAAAGPPLVTAEDPREMIVEYSRDGRRSRLAALKTWTDGAASWCVLWAGGKRFEWSRTDGDWTVAGEPIEIADVRLHVPVFEFICKPKLRGQPRPEISDSVITNQDRINKTLFDKIVGGEFVAWPQRYTIGIEVELDPETGKPKNPLHPGPAHVWALQSEEPGSAKIDQLDPGDFTTHLKSIEADVQYMAATTKTPMYYLLGQMVNVSADAIRAAETGLVAKVRRHQTEFGETWEDVIRAGLAVLKDPRADDDSMEMVWANPEARSLAELVDAATKKQSVGVPWRQNMEDIGYSPQQIERMDAERAADQLLAQPTTQVPVGAGAQ